MEKMHLEKRFLLHILPPSKINRMPLQVLQQIRLLNNGVVPSERYLVEMLVQTPHSANIRKFINASDEVLYQSRQATLKQDQFNQDMAG